MWYNFLCQIGALMSESFSERMISAVNLLVDDNRIRLGHDFIDDLIVSRMSKRFMERARYT